jgi:hypothetical protein
VWCQGSKDILRKKSFVKSAPGGASIGCYHCKSLNGSDPRCDDPFSQNADSSVYQANCISGEKEGPAQGRQGCQIFLVPNIPKANEDFHKIIWTHWSCVT